MPDLVGNVTTWILSQANGLIIIFLIVGVVVGVFKKSIAVVLTTILLGVFAFVFVNNMDAIKEFSINFGNTTLGR